VRSSFSQDPMAAWHWAGLAISAEVLQLKVGANQAFPCRSSPRCGSVPSASTGFCRCIRKPLRSRPCRRQTIATLPTGSAIGQCANDCEGACLTSAPRRCRPCPTRCGYHKQRSRSHWRACSARAMSWQGSSVRTRRRKNGASVTCWHVSIVTRWDDGAARSSRCRSAITRAFCSNGSAWTAAAA